MHGLPRSRAVLAPMLRPSAARFWAAIPTARADRSRFQLRRSAPCRRARCCDAPAPKRAIAWWSPARLATPRWVCCCDAMALPLRAGASRVRRAGASRRVISCRNHASPLPKFSARMLRPQWMFRTASPGIWASSAALPLSPPRSKWHVFRSRRARAPLFQLSRC